MVNRRDYTVRPVIAQFAHIARKLLTVGLLGASLLAAIHANPAAAVDYEITINDGSAAKNQSIIFDYPNIGPNFEASANINLVNISSQHAKVKLASITEDSTDQNELLPFVQLGLSRDGVALGRGAFDSDTLIGASTCVEPNSSQQLQANFLLPNSVGNVAQNTSLRVIYSFQITQGPCETITPIEPGEPSKPNALPPTGETMWPFWILGGLTISFFLVALIFFILILAKRRRQK